MFVSCLREYVLIMLCNQGYDCFVRGTTRTPKVKHAFCSWPSAKQTLASACRVCELAPKVLMMVLSFRNPNSREIHDE